MYNLCFNTDHMTHTMDHVTSVAGHVTIQAPPPHLSEVSQPLCLLGDAPCQQDIRLCLLLLLQDYLYCSVTQFRVVAALVGVDRAAGERENLGTVGRVGG